MPLFVAISAEYCALLSIHIGRALSKLRCWSAEPSTGGQSTAGSVVAVVSSGEVELSVAADVSLATSSLENAPPSAAMPTTRPRATTISVPHFVASSGVVNALLTKLPYLTSGFICFFAFTFCGSHGCEGYRHLRSRSHVKCRRLQVARRRSVDLARTFGEFPNLGCTQRIKSCPGRTRPLTR